MAVVVDQIEARRELVRREQARRSLIAFSEYVFPWYHAAAHHDLAAEYLEQVETFIRTRGKSGIGRLLILMPPRHGKSQLAARNFPAWVLGRLPDTRVIVTSYGADLAVQHGRAVREILYSQGFQAVFGERSVLEAPVEISVDSRSAQSWDLATPHRGGLLAAGVGGGITGRGAHLFVVDDPFKNREEAESEAHRESVWEWWTSTAYTRLEDGAGVVGMLTRWHGDDWAGRLLKAMANDPKADRWVVLCLPAIWETPSELTEENDWDTFHLQKLRDGVWVDQQDPLMRKPDQALWPAKYNEEDLDRIEANIGDYEFSALYQQTPYAKQGAMFQREWFPIVEHGPEPEKIVKRVRYWDKAGSKSGRGDYAAGVLMTLTVDELVFVEHVARKQCTPGQRDELIQKTTEFDMQRKGKKPEIWHQKDPGSAGLDSAMATNRLLAKIGVRGQFEDVTGDKETRAGPWSGACEGGMVRLVRGGWNEAFIGEHVAFPRGKYDDQVDSGSSAFAKVMGRPGKKEARSYQG
jgi:predicted phage terminase large subunit-like protein